MRLIKQFSPEIALHFGTGDFDDYLVILTHPTYYDRPRDDWYFGKLVEFASKMGTDAVYSDFVSYYNEVGGKVENYILDLIEDLSQKYPDPIDAELVHTILYLGMIAEENKAGSILRSRIKRLGVHNVLKDGFTPQKAATFSRGRNWFELSGEMVDRGF